MDFVLAPVLAMHLLAMNVASAGPLVCAWLEWKERRGDAISGEAASYLGRAALLALIVGGLLGLVVGALHWNPSYEHLWTVTLRYKALWAIGEYFFSLILIGVYVGWRRSAQNKVEGTGRWFRMAIAFVAGANLLYHFPFLFTIATSVQQASTEVPPLTSPLFRQWMMRQDVLARVVHVAFASFAVCGMVLLGLVMRKLRSAPEDEGVKRFAKSAGWLALAPSLTQIPVGLWLIASLPADGQSRVMGGDLIATALLAISVVAAIFMLQDFASIAFGDLQRLYLHRSMMLMVAIVFFMTVVLVRSRPPRTEVVDEVVTTREADLGVQHVN